MYKEHAQFNLLIALPLLLAAGYFFLHPKRDLLLIFGGTFAYSTLFMNPDMDLANQIRLFSLRGFFSLPFRSYSKFFSHRGLSHNLLLGSATRILWLMGWGVLGFILYYEALPTQKSLLSFYHMHEGSHPLRARRHLLR